MSFRDMRGFPRVVNAVGSDMGGMIARSVLVDSDTRHVPKRRVPYGFGGFDSGSGFVKSLDPTTLAAYGFPNGDSYGEFFVIDSLSGSGSVGFRTAAITGKRYIEIVLKKRPANLYTAIGVMANNGDIPCSYCSGNWTLVTGVNGNNCGLTNGSGGANYNGNRYSDPNLAFKQDDVIGVACDATTGRVWFSRNGQWTLGSVTGNLGSHPSKGEYWINSAFQMLMNTGAFYFYVNHYTCFTGGGPFVYEIHSKAATMIYGPPEGFLPFDNTPP